MSFRSEDVWQPCGTRSWVAEAMAHWVFCSSEELGRKRGVTDNISWTQAELELNPSPAAY